MCAAVEAQAEWEGLLEGMRQRREKRNRPELTEDHALELETEMQWLSKARHRFGPVVSAMEKAYEQTWKARGLEHWASWGPLLFGVRPMGLSVSLWGYAGEKKS